MKKTFLIFFVFATLFSTAMSQNMEGDKTMNTIIVYSSTTGFTKQYAQWISEETGFEAIDFKCITSEQIQNADRVVFGSSIKADHLMNLDKILQMNPKNLVIFAVGLTEKSEEYTKKLCEVNVTGEIPLIYMRGGVRFSKLGFFSRFILKKITGLSEDTDYSNKENIADLVKILK